MKLIFMSYNEAVDEEMMALLERIGVDGYTKWTEVLGKGRQSGPHLNSHAWPKANNCMAIAVTEAQSGQLLEEVRRIRQKLGHQGIKAFQLPLEEVT